jgi:hypothetical protein
MVDYKDLFFSIIKEDNVCPNCNKLTSLQVIQVSSTCLFFPIVLDENGNNINPDKNKITTEYKCLECDNTFKIIKGGYENEN